MFSYYIKEIKNRSCFIFLTWISTIIISYNYKEKLLFLCLKPNLSYFKTESFYFIFTNITEVFYTYLELSYFISNQMVLIKILYHIIIFISPGLYKFEYNKLINLIFVSTFLFLIFVFILNTLLLPMCCNFFLSFKNSDIHSVNFFFEAKINEFISFYLKFYKFCFAGSFLFVFIYFLLNLLRIDNTNFFIYVRKNCYFLFLIFATLVTPPDILSQIFLVSIFILLFEFLLVLKILQDIFNKEAN